MMNVRKSVGIFKRVKDGSSKIKENAHNLLVRVEKKVEGTMAENWLKYWKQVTKDYKDVAFDVMREARDKPTKTILIGSTGALLTYCAQQNPSATHYRDAFLKAANEASLVHEEQVRKETLQHLRYIEQSYNNQLIRYTSLGIISFVWIDNFSNKCATFETQCSYLQIQYSQLMDRIIDIGFLNNWWILSKKMTDYDINY